jgi:hypothetical protein
MDIPELKTSPFKWTMRYVVSFTRNGSAALNFARNSVLAVSLDWTRLGIRNRNWKQQVKEGRSATTERTVTKWTYSRSALQAPRLTFIWPNVPVDYINYMDIVGGSIVTLPSDPLSVPTVYAENAAKMLSVKRIRQAHTSFSGGTFLAEIRDTLRMLKQPAASLRNRLEAYRAKAKKLTRRTATRLERQSATKALAGEWLEFQFGAIPLGSDVASAITNLLRIGERQRRTFSAKVGFDLSGSEPYQTAAGDIAGYNMINRQFTRCGCAIKGAFLVKSATDATSWVDSWGLGTEDFVPAIWEWIPWSFAIDYFTNIGEILSAYSLFTGNITWCYMVTKRETRHEVSNFTPYANQPGSIITREELPHLVTTTRTLLYRKPITPDFLTSISLVWEVPGYKSLRWLNLAALLASRNKASPQLSQLR